MSDVAALNERRLAIRLTQAELAAKASLNKDTVWRFFAGRVDHRGSTARKIVMAIEAEEASMAARFKGCAA